MRDGGSRALGPDGPTRVFDLEQPRIERMPIHPAHEQAGYSYLLQRRHEDEYRPEEAGPRTGAAGIIICGEHTGTHIDALCHQSDALVLYGGVKVDSSVQTPRGFKKHGVEDIPPILAPGVLLAAAGVYRFDFVCTPLKFVGATGSPVRPVAVVRST